VIVVIGFPLTVNQGAMPRATYGTALSATIGSDTIEMSLMPKGKPSTLTFALDTLILFVPF
jgi:hypothetical protein